MSLIIATLIILFVWVFMISPFLKIYKATKQFRQTMNRAQQQARDHFERQRQAAREQQQPRPRKKIDPAVGEYVEFTETTVETSSTAGSDATTRRTTVTEQQITDVTWEDLP